MLILVFNKSLIKKRKYDVNGVIAVTKTDNLRTYPLTREKIQYNCGDGYICEDIALGLGLLNQSNDNPKKELIKYVAESSFFTLNFIFLCLSPLKHHRSPLIR